ncbi:MAG: phosphoribosylaminoimidazolesuccinocarboxamide synthase [Phycisphaerales bacterium]|nr:phosphoribosylaminoimidazolesuccinocarboxamide synthase [Phycisphaerales bacterium]
MPTADALFETRLPLPGRRQGKVRDLYELSPDAHGPRLLLVASDRISAFDVVMPTPIAGKGRLLTQMASGWFALLRNHSMVRDHLLSTDLPFIPGIDDRLRSSLAGRTMVCRAAHVVPIECVARGYLTGSGWVEYQQSGSVCGVELPSGLAQCARLPSPIFSPATKAVEGHDENISFENAASLVGSELMTTLRELTLRIYSIAAEHALARGVILADTKFEFGFALDAAGAPTTELMLVDEVLTPDSSRYWDRAQYAAGREQASFDKQFLRNWLLSMVADGHWNKSAPGPDVPAEIVAGTVARYEEALERLFPAP